MVQTSQQTKSHRLAALVVTLCRIWQVAVLGGICGFMSEEQKGFFE